MLALVAGGQLGCRGGTSFQCESNDQCSQDGLSGTCQPTGYCSFPDLGCASGERYGELAAAGFAGYCVPDDGDSGTGDAGETDDGPTVTEDPPECGNGVAETDEDCDGADVGGATCASVGFAGGALSCAADCSFDTSNCTQCGNGTVDGTEQCDGADLGGIGSCADVGLGEPTEAVGCDDDCRHDYSMCSACGDGTIMPPEQCEPGNVGDQTCVSQGFDGGVLQCTPGFNFDTTGCADCGNAVQDP
ncbi:MAG: hypothetical protein AB1Z98_28880, partial [Nannocystaceae bacterium]